MTVLMQIINQIKSDGGKWDAKSLAKFLKEYLPAEEAQIKDAHLHGWLDRGQTQWWEHKEQNECCDEYFMRIKRKN